ncbi:hypothetical protein CHLNCDRAFT_138260 [Chlorella variabilis]|uniref:Potassium channel inwardly rectifying transmembrane domain-containing protein n=1 Tax=Chlorella variabilis TaxID=554065 RepID=E1ZMN1_CHLVA|nr:hypothetical protein CHLNCDRAFT_138260 [Chlorella variabilis]EFN52826.1 hypothetical protein CHLNCDRAFT_138260 [Chlorella variabilis]|eukprot:XP_005844928.1 hypothetical protein CHLNCDRAFT_138260 [Chlorella variabilis]
MSVVSGSYCLGNSPSSSGYTTPRFRPVPPIDAYLPTRVLDSKRAQRPALDRVNLRCWHLPGYLFKDWYSTLVNCRWHRFYALFLLLYFGMFAAFAALYVSQPPTCISNSQNFWHALWFSVHTSSTIGYGAQAPNPDCYLLQLGIMAQVLVSLFMQGTLLGLVFARISNSAGRSATIRFSKVLSMWVGEDGVYRLTFRVANMRRHQVLKPEVRMLLLRRQLSHPFSSDASWEYLYSELPAEHVGGGRLWLGVPSLIEHRVDSKSPLSGMSEGDIKGSDMELIVLLDGIDETTSRCLQARWPPAACHARHSYVPSDIRWHHRFDSCLQRRRSGKLGVDFSRFDSTAPRSASSASLHVLHAMASAQSIQSVPSGGARGSFGAAAAAAVQQHLQQQQYRAASMGTGAAAPSSFAGGLAGPYAGSLGSMPAPAPASTLGPTAHSTAPGPVLAAPRDARTG